MVNKFPYPTGFANALEQSLSSDRLQSYLTATNGNQTKALQLYLWNTELSAALYSPLQGLEIAFRNALHRELSNQYRNNWYDTINHILTDRTNENIDKAKQDISKRGKSVTPPRVVAELSFGFWVSLLGKGRRGKNNYEMTLWRPALHKAFSNRRLNRKTAYRELNNIKELRNRIAHHEPIIHNRNVLSDYYNILDITSWICRDTALWIASNNKFLEVLNSYPET